MTIEYFFLIHQVIAKRTAESSELFSVTVYSILNLTKIGL